MARSRATFAAVAGLWIAVAGACSDREADRTPAPVAAAPPAAPPAEAAVGEWNVLLDGTSFDGWQPVGDASWRVVDGAVLADSGNGFLVSLEEYGDFELRAEFWVDAAANSGIFLRASDPQAITPQNAYEVNVFDARPDPTYRTGAIVDLAAPATRVDTADRWNTYEIRADGPHLVVTLNGVVTADLQDTKLARGPIALQSAGGTVKFRSVQVRALR